MFIGIDVAKHRHEVAVLDAQGDSVGKSFSIPNSTAGFAELVQRLQGLGPPAALVIGMEATGTYGWPLYHRLADQGFRVRVLNPLQTSGFAKTCIRKTKTDPIDARRIAQVLRVGKTSDSFIPDERTLRLRELTRYRHAVLTLHGRFSNLLHSRLSRTFPEFIGHFAQACSATPLALLESYPLPGDLLQVPPAQLRDTIRRKSRGRCKPHLADELLNAARGTIGLTQAADVYSCQIRGIVRVVRTLDEHLDEVTRQISQVLHEVPQMLTTIPGIADLSAAAILGEIGDISRYDDPKKLVAFAGLDPTVYQTGNFVGSKAHISKRGSPYLRCAVWNAAFASLRTNGDLRDYYVRKRAQGKHHKAALTAVSRKLLHVVWRILKDNRAYEVRPNA